MIVINTIADVRRLEEEGKMTSSLAGHLARKLERLRGTLAPDLLIEEFDTQDSGTICILEAGDRDLTEAGLPADLSLIMPEWISRLTLPDFEASVLYVMATNDVVVQVYLPDAVMPEAVRLWLAEQPDEEIEHDEAEGGEANGGLPEPF